MRKSVAWIKDTLSFDIEDENNEASLAYKKDSLKFHIESLFKEWPGERDLKGINFLYYTFYKIIIKIAYFRL